MRILPAPPKDVPHQPVNRSCWERWHSCRRAVDRIRGEGTRRQGCWRSQQELESSVSFVLALRASDLLQGSSRRA